MNQQSFGQKTGPDTAAGSGAAGPATGAGQQATSEGKPAGLAKDANQAVLGPFTVRDLAVFVATLILFIASLLPIFGGRYNLWNLNNLFFLGLGIILPLIVSALFAARRLAPATKIRIGSLSIDQFASVVACFAVAFFFLSVAGAYVPSLLVGLIGTLILFAATVLGRFLPYLSGDFKDRAEVPAHVVAREAAAPVQKPRAPKQPKPESASKPGGGKLLGAAGGKLFGGAGAGSSAVQPGPTHHAPATAAVPTTAAPHSPATAAVPSAGVAAAGGPAAGGPVSTAPEVSDRAPEVDAGPPTQAADVVRPASAPAAEETQFGDVHVGAGAGGSSATSHHDGGAQPAASAARSTWEPPAATAVHQQVRSEEPIGATVDPASRHYESDELPIHEAFWFAVAQHRTAYDPRTGAPAFVIEPGGWVLALEDRGHEFLVQHTDGRLGVLRDLSNIERG
ncbi:hypothetical protein DXK94_09985 [Arthrobacter sp. RT-1]|uniref:hypothetical protein n=1 Tax=Arthrobacter sp. RT-1 TaxID=2292263 RepID=UPI000E1F0381|nr:hypothetical protein [Arthrobacter sp. RT-1]RDV10188.1 hypothetical protein DXK94_09985 [Arthrobacter sp. RT-1]